MDSHFNPRQHPFFFVSISALVVLTAMLLSSTSLAPLSLISNLLNGSTPIVRDARTGVSYRGTSTNSVDHFQNIFYAEDTSGLNRFAPPVPYMPSPGTIVDTTAAGASCPQGLGGPPLPWTSPITNVSENCLSLRIARSSGTGSSAKLPVLVYIHGGGDALGSASDILYTPDGLVMQAKSNGQPVIYVGINYRLGIFGYAANKALKAAKQANAGLRDQRTAFNWVRDNIEAFGGDPGNVVAVGQSVGAMSVGLHLLSYSGTQGVPFQKAVMMSGASGTNFNIMSNLVADNTATVANTVGCTGDPDSQATLNCLRNTPLKFLMDTSVELARKLRPPFGELAFYPSYDGDYIPDRPSVLLRKGAFVKGISLIGSWVANDGAWYAQPTLSDDASVLASFETVVLGLSQSSSQRLLALYPLADFNYLARPGGATADYYRAAQINRDLWFTCPVIDFTWQYTRFGGDSSVRLYDMNQTKFGPILQYMGVPQWRVSHLSDIPYLMNEDVAAGGDNSAPQRELSALLSGSISAFANRGDPTISRGPTFKDWPIAYSDQSAQALRSDFPNQLNVYVVGGPLGSGPASMASGTGSGASARDKAVTGEKVIQRCGFINSILEEIEG